jgi:hypothetical protein
MRDQNELMVFVLVAGILVLAALWSLMRWSQLRRDVDPPAHFVAVLAFALLGGLVGLGRWSWIGERYGLGFWLPFAAAGALLVTNWIREVRARRRGPQPPRAAEDVMSGGGSPAAARERRP